MQFEQAFNAWKPALAQLSSNEVKTPSIPIDEMCAEAETLSVVCHKDKTELLAAGLNWQYVDDLKSLSLALRFCQAHWLNASGRTKEAAKWQELKKEAFELKKELLRHFNYAFYHHPSIKKKLITIGRHRDINNLILDLLLLANLADNNADVLQNINYNTEQTTQARTLSRQVSEQYASAKLNKGAKVESKLWRDRAYTLLSHRMSEVRTCGQYISHNNDKKYQQYVSNYYRKLNAVDRSIKSP
ncbi:hypothetical protein [Carboxylicivirga sp. M1479]|uniref:hypothetical protein n=1 Tax=Carboxylicivirga sp. M1479 TaxID=2594476 RepID=UPI00117813E4|nr:hypothetical protein [Carboxylicivirga sp. M1479]TRX71834.1 hypothetical protein FNN09_04235 [Carboxylicivirga sp. M1479]